MIQEARVQFQVKSYQRVKKWYMMPPCLTFSIIRYRSRINEGIQGKKVVSLPWHLSVVAFEKRTFGSPLTKVGKKKKIISFLASFFTQIFADVFYWSVSVSVSDSKSPLVSRTLFYILADLNNADVWMILIHQPIPNSSRPPFPSLWEPFQSC